MAFGQTRDEILPEPKKEEKPVAIPVGNIGVVNLEQQKKPHNINIRNFNPNEPKVKANMKYSGKQNYRRYKTKIEPNLISKILVNDENNIVNKIKEAFGIQPDSQNSNFSEVETSSVPFYKGVDETIREPERPARGRPEFIDDLINEIIDISLKDAEELTFQQDPEYDFNTEFTPKNKISRREHTLHEDDFDIFQEKQYPLTMAFATPEEKILNRLSEELTPKAHLLRTEEEKRKAQEDAEEYLHSLELTVNRLTQISRENVTKRRVGRPAGAYGPVRRIQEAIDRTPDENIEYFKSRKNRNKAANKPQLSLQEIRDKQRNDEFRLQNFMFP